MALSDGWPLPAGRLACTLAGGALAAASAGVLNCLWEEGLDGRMQRTSGRALPSGRLSSRYAFALAVTLALAATGLLLAGVNGLAAGLSLLGLCSYVLLYTVLLKPRTPRTSSSAGWPARFPPGGLGGGHGSAGVGGWWLFSLVMLWTPAHFWALALLLREDYRSVGIPMLPVVAGPVLTVRAIGHYARATALFSLAGIVALPAGGLLYGLLVLPFNARLLQLVADLQRDPDDPKRARRLFAWSILYLFGICLLLLLSRLPAAELFGRQGSELLLGALPFLH
ncbi:heme o synthase [Cyanobium sp. ATX-6F1]|uniref:heme o synthase n=1 Tax=Cyanobium sp. ATX-6F1 TaxID=3137388 RepID=UPI0039BE36DC